MVLHVDEQPLSSQDDAASLFRQAAKAAEAGEIKSAITFADLATNLLRRQTERAGQGPESVEWPDHEAADA